MDVEAEAKLWHYIFETLQNQAKENTNNVL
jgi:hypothetical protein